ncbi:sugar transferase [Rhodobacter ferrooxidans]|uniref:Sugar transferase n=1 Tax=Rhodobacter ferrooxidans TaxID=371731 RepID=C8S497_9RHOB|nr:sugar transferase [Rhodobacter sp. SW2]EEW24156.1 sugar transferase [Rhodobacter sp. SW2]
MTTTVRALQLADTTGKAEPALPPLVLPDPTTSFCWKVKRGSEWLMAATLLTLLSVPLLAIALLIRLESPGPVLFCQPRFGRDNRPFKVLKFRTMRTDRCDLSGGMQTAHRDPRITRVGMILRKSSLDELPQLVNVLRGDMALIGPRAHPCGMRVEGVLCEHLDPHYHHRHRIPPGVTGWAQVNGSRGPVDTSHQLRQRVQLDLDYIRNWSLGRDVAILLRTVVVCLRATGAR